MWKHHVGGFPLPVFKATLKNASQFSPNLFLSPAQSKKCQHLGKKHWSIHLLFVHSKVWAKNDSRTNIERHTYTHIDSRFNNMRVSGEIHRRILKSFAPDWEHRFSFYKDNGWVYLCRSGFILGRFRFRYDNGQISTPYYPMGSIWQRGYWYRIQLQTFQTRVFLPLKSVWDRQNYQ